MKFVVTSPMRTGSTWVYELLQLTVCPAAAGFVSTWQEAQKLAENAESCVLKSHSLIDTDVQKLRGKLFFIRILRNYKDSLISRALYCRNVRRAEGELNDPVEDAMIDECYGMTDRAFVNVFLSRCPQVISWMEDLVVYERGDFDHTFYYEMLLHNPREQFRAWMAAHEGGVEWIERLDAALDHCSFSKMRAQKTPNFVGSTGVGQWMHLLDEPVWRQLDALYLLQKETVRQMAPERRPVTRPANPAPK